MDWTKFNNHGESPNRAFEVMCNILFESWCRREYKDSLCHFAFVNGNGGDGGVEAYGVLTSGDVIGVQSKWFPNKMTDSHFSQIENSFHTAIKVRPKLKKYIVCVPRDLTSKKMYRKKQVAKGTEEAKWIKLCNKINESHPDVAIELWNETRIQDQLSKPDTQGCFKYWFESSELFEEEIKTSYDKAVNSWAKTSYLPDLYSKGYIHDKLSVFAGSYDVIAEKYRETAQINVLFQELKKAYEDILRLNSTDQDQDFFEKIKADITILEEWSMFFERLCENIASGTDIRSDILGKKIELNCKISDLKESSLRFNKSAFFHPAETLLQGFEEKFEEYIQFVINDEGNKLIFLGNPGTGKTSGIVGEINWMIQEKSHLPILVHASDFSEGDNWLSILTGTIGLSSMWDERELFRALENAALLRNKSSNEKHEVEIQPKCLICVDGIDEASSWDFWKNRIEETKVYESDYPNLKFIFLSRPYVFHEYRELEYSSCFCTLPNNGDVPINKIFDDYISFYNIDLCDNFGIKGLLRTPIALKLFCEKYKDRSVGDVNENSLVITNLFKQKIDDIEKRFRRTGKETWHDSMINITLVKLSTLLTDNKEISYEDIHCACSEPVKSHLSTLLPYIENEGFIYSHQICKDDFSEPNTVYSWGMQPAFDYLMGEKVFEKLQAGESIDLKYTTGIYQMLSLIAIEKDRKLIFQYPNLTLDDTALFDLTCYTLANTSTKIASGYRDYVKQLMQYSEAQFREIVSNIIIPVSNVENHPLGSILLDEFLREFDQPAERDIWWSIPAFLLDNYRTQWRTYTEIDTSVILLSNDDHYLGKPLILTWRLSSVDNDIRYNCRLKLTEWGINNSDEFLKLLKYCADINDEQIIEDIFAIAYGIALSQSVQQVYLENIVSWIIENVYSEEGFSKYENAAVRYYCRGIVKIAIIIGVCNAENERKISEQYIRKGSFLPAYKDAFDSKKHDGYGPIRYDLARYVLYDHLNGFFSCNYKIQAYQKETTIFLEHYKKKYDLDVLKPEGLIISIAYQYLLNQGWERKKFWEYKDKDNLGVDICIERTYPPATHGAMSRKMTIAEKYVWCARHRLEAVFSSQMMYSHYNQEAKFINNYYEVDNFINTYQEYVNSENAKAEIDWLHTELVAVTPYKELSISNIQKWMTQDDIPKFESWIDIKTDYTILYAFTNIVNDFSGIEESIWISSGIVKSEKFEEFISAIDSYPADSVELWNTSDFHSYIDTYGFYTPQEICAVQTANEVNNSIHIGDQENNLIVHKLVSSCLTEHAESVEKRFYLPSEIVRRLTNITYGDGYKYANESDELICRYTDIGEGWKNQQECLQIKSNALLPKLEETGYKIFWVFRVYRSPSIKAYELYDKKVMHNTDRSFVIWFDEKGCKYIESRENKLATQHRVY